MKSRLLDALAILSLGCLLAVIGLWIASYHQVFQIFPASADQLGVICRGRIYWLGDESHIVMFERTDPQVDAGWHWAKTPIAASLMTNLEDPGIRLSGEIHGGFGVIRVVYFRLSIFTRSCKVYVAPLWPTAVIFSMLPMIWALRFALRRRRRPGRCAACDYDLHATPDRCPECGTPVAPHASAGKLRRVANCGPVAVTLLLIVAVCLVGRRDIGHRRVDTDIDLIGGAPQLYAIPNQTGSTGPLTIDQSIAPTPSGIIGADPKDREVKLKVPDSILARLNPSAGSQMTARPQELIADVNLIGHGGPDGIWLTQNSVNEYSVGINSQQKGWKWKLASDPPKFHDNTYDITGSMVVEIYSDRTYKIRFIATVHSVSSVDPGWGEILQPTGATVRWIGPE